MKKQVIEEIRDMKYLFNYNRGRILSEQPEVKEPSLDEIEDYEDLDIFTDETNTEIDEEMDVPVMLPGTKEKERTITTPGIKPGIKPKTPYSPKPGPKKNPKAGEKDIPNWLTFDELGITFE